MADQSIVASADTYLLKSSGGTTRHETDAWINLLGTAGVHGAEPCLEFDVSSMAGKTWDSVVLALTFRNSPAGGGEVNAAVRYIDKAVVVSGCTYNEYNDVDDLSWDNPGGRSDADSDNSAGATWHVGPASADDTHQSTDLTTWVNKANDENGGVLPLLIAYSTGGTYQQFHSIESAEPESSFPTLVFTNVQEAAADDNGGTGTAVNVPTGSVSISRRSNRPPVQEPSRQTTVSLLHNGVEPMTILALITKVTYGVDA